MPGYRLGLDFERQTAVLAAESLNEDDSPGDGIYESGPNHSTISRARRRIPAKTQDRVFTWALDRLRDGDLEKLLAGSTSVAARMALGTLRRMDTVKDYRAFVVGLAEKADERIPGQNKRNQRDGTWSEARFQ